MIAPASFRLLSACNNRCVFCAQDGLSFTANSQEEIASSLSALRTRASSLLLLGGEPTLDPRLLWCVETARSLGFSAVGLQTNARRLADSSYTEALRSAGLTDVHATLLGPDAAAHDYHTGISGSFVQSMAGIAASRGCGLRVVVSTVLTRSNYRSLAPMPKLLVSRGVSAWCLWVPRAAGRALDSFDRVYPRLGLAIPFALHALSVAEKLRLPAWIAGAPRCLLGPYAKRSLPTEPMQYAKVCEPCVERSACAGFDPVYLRRFEGDEASVRSSAIASEHVEELSRWFVGAGALRVKGVTPWENAGVKERAKVQLPMLGRPQPAKNEVSMRGEKRTGEALKEIFPALFTEKKNDPENGDGSNE